MEVIKMPLNVLKTTINNNFSTKEPWQIVSITTSTVLFSVWFYNFVCADESLSVRAKKRFFKLIKLLPAVRDKIDLEMKQIQDSFEKTTMERTSKVNYILELPKDGISSDEIVKILDENLSLGDYDWKKGRVSGSIYYHNNELIQLVANVYGKTSYTNPLHPDVFPGLCKMEAEVIRISANLFHGDVNTCGTMTSGGTESILMACKAYRDYARDEHNITKPEIIVPTTVHAAFDKAAQYFGLKVKYINIDPVTTLVDIDSMRRAITSNTILLVGSAPNFPYGTMDDISAISDLGLMYNIPVHVDSCLGGFLTPFMVDAGYPIPMCDFQLLGVTSISADTHKYGFTPKGSSVILYRDKKLRHYQYTVTTDWPGGVYGSPTISGSRPGGSIAACWATLLKFGKDGYVQATRDIIHTTKHIEKGLRRMKGIYVYGQPTTSVVAIGSNVFDIYRLATILSEGGWNLNILQFPSGIHLCVTHMHTLPGVADKFLTDVQNALTEILKEPGIPVEGKMALYGVAQSLPDRSLVGQFTRYFLDSMFSTPKK